MDRFEAYKFLNVPESLLYLHSSMDRFEATARKDNTIYERNLHSSMDRFEAVAFSIASAYSSLIYIPVWIDLKLL